MSERAVVDRLTCVLCPVGCELEVRRAGPGEAGPGAAGKREAGPEGVGKDEFEDKGADTGEPDGRGTGEEETKRTGPGGPGIPAERADEFEVRGNQCEKGVPFAIEEVLRPKRNLATSVLIKGTAARMVSVRLSRPVPREMIFPILAEIAKLRPEAPVRRGQVLVADVLGTGADVIATRTVQERVRSTFFEKKKI